MKIEFIKEYLLDLQSMVSQTLQLEESRAKFITDQWTKSESGNGCTMVIEGGEVIERAAVNFSHVCGADLPQAATAKRPELIGRNFEVAGVSLIIHPRNPYAPTCNMNLRFFIAEKENEKPVWWFGGGFDLTPYYGFEEDCRHWHQVAHDACAPFGAEVYPKFKQW